MNYNILYNNPFNTLDQEGVSELVEFGIERGRRTRENEKLKVGVCDEHGGPQLLLNSV